VLLPAGAWYSRNGSDLAGRDVPSYGELEEFVGDLAVAALLGLESEEKEILASHLGEERTGYHNSPATPFFNPPSANSNFHLTTPFVFNGDSSFPTPE